MVNCSERKCGGPIQDPKTTNISRPLLHTTSGAVRMWKAWAKDNKKYWKHFKSADFGENDCKLLKHNDWLYMMWTGLMANVCTTYAFYWIIYSLINIWNIYEMYSLILLQMALHCVDRPSDLCSVNISDRKLELVGLMACYLMHFFGFHTCCCGCGFDSSDLIYLCLDRLH